MYDLRKLSDRQTELCNFGMIKRIEIPALWDQNREPVPFRVGTIQLVFYCKVPIPHDSAEFLESKLHFFWQEKPRASNDTMAAFKKLTAQGPRDVDPAEYSKEAKVLPFRLVDHEDIHIHAVRSLDANGQLLIEVESTDSAASNKSLDMFLFDASGRRLQIYFSVQPATFEQHRPEFLKAIESLEWA